MLITGTLFYNCDLNNKEFFAYNGELMEKTDRMFFNNIDDFEFSEKAFKLDWKTDELENFENVCKELNTKISIYEVKFNDSENKIGFDYLDHEFPVTLYYTWCDMDDLYPPDYSESLSEIMHEIDIYLNPTKYLYFEEGLFYKWITAMLLDKLECYLSTDDFDYIDEEMLNFAKECFDFALNHPDIKYGYMPEFERTFPDINYYLEDNEEFQKMYDSFNKEVARREAEQDVKTYLK